MPISLRTLALTILCLAMPAGLSAQTAEEILQRSAQVVSESTSFSGRGWGCTHVVGGGIGLLSAYEVLHRAPDDWLIVSLGQRWSEQRQFAGGAGQSFVSQLGTVEQKRGGWSGGELTATTSDPGRINLAGELTQRLINDPFAPVLHHWLGGAGGAFDWGLTELVLKPESKLGGEPNWHVVGRGTDGQEVHLWISQASTALLRSVVVHRTNGIVRRVSEWYYDQVFNPGNLTNISFTNPRRLPYVQPLSPASMSLTEFSELMAEFGAPQTAVATAAPAGKPAAASRSVSAHGGTQQLTPEQMAAIVLIESGDGQASGFLTKLRGVDFVVTNLHVLGPDPQLVVRNLNGDILPVQGVFGAFGRDVAIMRVGTTSGDLSPAEDLLNVVKIGDEVVVVGNRQGGRVATQVSGKVLGIGPGRIEVDAPFEPGNSGSPVVHLKSGKVIGVASYSEIRKNSDDSSETDAANSDQPEQRWFAYRLDGITQWEAISLDVWKNQYRQITEFYEDTHALYVLSRADLNGGKVNPRIRPYVESFEERFGRFGSNSAGLVGEMQNFLGNLRGRGQTGVRELKSGQFYDYFRSSLYWKTNIKDQLEFREWTLDRLERMTRNVDGWRAQVRSGQGR